MTTLYSRSYNPIWDFRSLTGLPLDDTSWAYFLQDTIPYAPQNVYQTENGTPWPSPVQLSAAGTLQNIFFDPTLVYRIEIRTNLGNLTPPSQSDALVWLIEDYVPNGGSVNPPITTGTIASSNEITNPQFALINFASPLTLTNQASQTISVAPGWDLVLSGAASDVTLTQLALNSADPNPTNAPYALELTLTGWTTAYLRQTFSQNGILWANKNVTGSLTARINGVPQTVTTTLVDSDANLLGTIITASITANYSEFTGNALLAASANTDVPPNASIEYRINLPGSCDISITSLQLLATNNAVALTYEQDTVERQIDHTFHNYKTSLLTEEKSSILTGWDFPLNPWQFTTTTLTTLASASYTADQTIVVPENASSIKVGQNANGYLEIDSIIGQAQGRVAVIQFIDPNTIASSWSSVLSSLAQMMITTSESTIAKVKIRLIESNDLPAIINPIDSWGAVDPVFTAQWTSTALAVNDPAYTLTSTLTDFSYNGFITAPKISSTQTLGIVMYTINPLSTLAVDKWLIKSVSLVQNDFAIRTNSLTFDETLKRCQFYYEKSYDVGVLPGTSTFIGYKQTIVPIILDGGGDDRVNLPAVAYNFQNYKRTETSSMTFYSNDGTSAKVDIGIFLLNAGVSSIQANITSFTQILSQSNFMIVPTVDQHVSVGNNEGNTGRFGFQYVADARLGLVA